MRKEAQRIRCVRVNGVELAYTEQGAGVPVVLVHGSVNDMRTWGAQVAPLSSRNRVIAYSRRYHYPNALPDDADEAAGYRLATQADDLRALIETLGPGGAHLVCSSYGGCVALQVVARSPHLVRSLVLGEPPLLPWLANLPEGAELYAAQGRVMQAAAEAFRQGEPERGIAVFINAVSGYPLVERLSPEARARLMDNAPATKLESVTPPELYFPALTPADLSRIETPTLLLGGASSPRMFGLVLDVLEQHLPRVQRVTLAGASHGMHSSHPGLYNDAVLAFLESTGASSGSAPPAPEYP